MITKELFGKKPCGCPVEAYTLTNKNGSSVQILSMGGIIRKICVPDKNGVLADVVCGFDTVEGYLTGGGYQGALIGRYGNRIGKGKFTLNGVDYQLALNDGENHLHGGMKGFNQKIWDVVPFEKPDACGLILTTVSEDGEENYPGRLEIKVTYTFSDKDELSIHYEAETDADTILNMTNHAYFNLNGYDSGDILSHLLTIDADAITAIDSGLIATGENRPVEGTPFDFRTPTAIGARIGEDDEQLTFGGGYDHNFVLNNGGKYAKIAELYSPKSGRCAEVYTDQPGVQIYAGNMMNGEVPFKRGIPQRPRHAVCMETQHAPDSPNHDNFPSVVLKKGEKYDTITTYAFSVR